MNKNKIVICYHLSLEKIQTFLNENKDNSCLKELSLLLNNKSQIK